MNAARGRLTMYLLTALTACCPGLPAHASSLSFEPQAAPAGVVASLMVVTEAAESLEPLEDGPSPLELLRSSLRHLVSGDHGGAGLTLYCDDAAVVSEAD